MRGTEAALTKRFVQARHDASLVVLEGFHALKHALRFDARIEVACTPGRHALIRLASEFAPDLCDRLAAIVEEVTPAAFARLAPIPPATGVLAVARRPEVDCSKLLSDPGRAPIVLLDNPSHLGNLGAVVRVAAAAGATGVLVTGAGDPWQPAALRGSAGLHFALPVARSESLPDSDRPLLAIDPEGKPMTSALLVDRAILAFGSERRGLSSTILACAHRRIAIPMRAGISSLNLASAVAVVLYTWRLARATRADLR